MLVGFMAAGKTTVGRLLARRLGWDFVDFDDAIHRRSGRAPGEIIRAEGEAAFRQMEAEVTDSLAGRARVVLAPGGGWATRSELAGRLGPGTLRVWLRVSVSEVLRRVRSEGTDRPLLGGERGRRARAESLMRTREPRYAEADLVVDVDGREPAEVVDEIIRRSGLQRE